MPSFTSLKYDLFISYRQADNKFGWVTKLDETLRSLLEEHARPGKNETPWAYEVFRDNREIGGHEVLGDVLREAVNSTAILVIVMSENYLATDSDWCAKELAMFRDVLSKSPHRDGRIFLVLRSDVAVPRRPSDLRQFVGYKFWEVDEASGTQQQISFDFSKTGRVPVDCQKLGDDIFGTLKRLRNGDAKPTTAPAVFLAEVTDELHADRSGVYSFLTQAGLRVVPGKNQQYRFTPEVGQAEIPPLLREATLIVQMHGRVPIPSDDAYVGGVERWLFEQAQAAGKQPGQTLLRWRRPGAKQAELADATHAEFAFGGDVIADDLEQFKQMIVQRVRELTQRRSVDVGGQGAKVLVISKKDSVHKPVVDDLADLIDLAEPPMQAALVPDELPLHMVAKEFDNQKASPRGLVVVHADADEAWVQAKMQECRRYQLSKKPEMPLCAVVVKPPDDQPHPRTVPGRFEVIPFDNMAMQQTFIAKLGEEVAP